MPLQVLSTPSPPRIVVVLLLPSSPCTSGSCSTPSPRISIDCLNFLLLLRPRAGHACWGPRCSICPSAHRKRGRGCGSHGDDGDTLSGAIQKSNHAAARACIECAANPYKQTPTGGGRGKGKAVSAWLHTVLCVWREVRLVCKTKFAKSGAGLF